MFKASMSTHADERTQPVTRRAAGRGIIGSINFALLLAGQNQVRKISGAADGTIDGYNALFAADAAEEETTRVHEEQGSYVAMPVAERCGYLACIAALINTDLKDHAEMVTVESGPMTGKKVYHPYHVGDSLRQTLQRQIEKAPAELTATQRLTARALGITEADMLASERKLAQTNAMFLLKHKVEILEAAAAFGFDNAESWDVEVVASKLPAIDQLRLMIAADNGMYFVRDNSAKRYIRNSQQKDLFTDIGLLDGEREKLHQRINKFCKEPKILQALRDARERGETIPVLRGLVTPLVEEKAA